MPTSQITPPIAVDVYALLDALDIDAVREDSFTPHLGPGFFLAVGATAVNIAASVLVWRERDE